MHSVLRDNYYKTFYMRYLPFFLTMVNQPNTVCLFSMTDHIRRSHSRPAGVNVSCYKYELLEQRRQ
jgi:hypothetical protein